ncbi:type II secretion system F family protein [Ferrovibrio sp.]|uniref:type II secretion system F family protein n=1 Tax=Ferrovibrio sp. TaxID=1917215 RepID=UPI001B41B8D5|nr:type II secretion system F family protein [Ferrovibrio sp.]MBP7064743.1 type II secretion system F family protein [Ferrovibrio sp.]
MPNFRYQALDRSGAERKGILAGADRAAVVAELQAGGLMPVAVEAVTLELEAAAAPALYSVKHCAALFGGLATLLVAGLPLDQALAAFAEIAAADKAGAATLLPLAQRLHQRLRRGDEFAAALQAEAGLGRGFEPLAIGLVAAGQASSDMPGALARLARLYERRQRNQAALQSALLYPAILLFVTLLVLALLLSFVIPQFELMFRDARHDLPLVTRLVFGIAEGLGQALWLLAVLALPAWLLLRRRLRAGDALAESWRLRLDALWLRLPLLGDLLRGLESERLGFVLASLLSAGVALPDALRFTADTLRNAVFAAALRMAAVKLRQGSRLVDAMPAGDLLPPLLRRLIVLGEAGSNLPAMMLKAAGLHEQESESRMRRLIGLIEPALVVVLGGIIAVTLVAVLSAIVDLNRLPL